MRFRLENKENSEHTVILTADAWFSILDLAEECGWNPIGTMPIEYISHSLVGMDGPMYGEMDVWPQGYAPGDPSLVLLEDALNLADSLERAFLDDCYLENSGYSSPPYISGYENKNGNGHAGVGVILILVDFCRMGAFWVEGV